MKCLYIYIYIPFNNASQSAMHFPPVQFKSHYNITLLFWGHQIRTQFE